MTSESAQRYREALARLDPGDQKLIVGRIELGLSYDQLALATERGEVYVPAGPYKTGAAGHAATTGAFYVDRTEVTNRAWEKAVKERLVAKLGPQARQLARRSSIPVARAAG